MIIFRAKRLMVVKNHYIFRLYDLKVGWALAHRFDFKSFYGGLKPTLRLNFSVLDRDFTLLGDVEFFNDSTIIYKYQRDVWGWSDTLCPTAAIHDRSKKHK